VEGGASSIARGHSGTFALRARIDTSAACGWLLAAVPIVYLGVRQGGYDTVIGSQFAIAAWWLILLLFAGGLVRARLSRGGAVGFALLCGYAAWTTLSLLWTESSEATIVDVSQMLLYVALMGLLLLVQGRAAIRFMLSGLACGITAIAVIAVLSRLHFQWFEVPTLFALPGSVRRLSYPIDYWNALAALMAVGMPVLLYCATGARSLIARAAAASAIPLLALCAFLTASRGGVIEIAVGLVVFVVLAPDRLSKLAMIAVTGAGSALLIEAANKRPEVRDGARTALAAHQGNQLIAIAIAVVAGVALLGAAVILVERYVERPRLLVLTRRQLGYLSAGGVVVAVVAFVAAGGVGFLHRKWTEFKSPGGFNTSSGNAFARLQSTSGEGRYQYWQEAAHTAAQKPLTGSGANTFQFEWLQHGVAAGGFVQDAHSMYMQALGDLGYPGFILITGFMLWILGFGVWRVIRTRDSAVRLTLAAATAGAFAFAFAAAIDWIWFIPVLPVALFVCASAIFARERDEQPDDERPARGAGLGGRRGALALRGAIAALSIAAIIVIALPMAATEQVRDSQALAASGNAQAALSHAEEAEQLEPYAAAGYLQAALVQEQAGNLEAALADAEQARKRQPVNWSIWIVLSRLEGRTGNAKADLADFRHARYLDPHNPLFS
jgi:tetratricopeptide (TPR) repeat protein